MKMTLNEYLKGRSIFELIDQAQDFPFILDDNVKVFDALMMFHYGNRIVFASVEMMEVEQVAELIASKYVEKWTKLVEAHTLPFELGSTTELTTESEVTDQNKQDSSDDLDKVSAYDSPELIVNAAKSLSGEEQMNINLDKTKLVEKKDINSVFDNLHLLQKNNIIETVIRDVADFLTLYIY